MTRGGSFPRQCCESVSLLTPPNGSRFIVTATTSERDRSSSVSLLRGVPLPELNKTHFTLPAVVLGFTYSGIHLRRRLLKARSRDLLEDQIVAGPMTKFRSFYKSEFSITVLKGDSFVEIT